jgi:transcriptional regulator with XRE-family HTH domain
MANNAYQRARTRVTFQGLVDVAEVREYLDEMRRSGVGTRKIADTTGLSRSTVWQIVRGATSAVRPETRARVLSLPHPHELIAYAPGLGASRRVRALHAMGWSFAEMARQLGWPSSRVSMLANHPGTIRRVSASEVKQLYQQLENQLPPDTKAARRSRLRSQRYGWAGPAAWDGLDMDDPACRPDGGWEPGRRTVSDLVEDVNFLLGMGETMEAIANRLNISQSYVRKLRGRSKDDDGLAGAAGRAAADMDGGQRGDPDGAGIQGRRQPAHAQPVHHR